MTIAERIRLYRQQKNLSQAELAEVSDVNNKSLSRYELGTNVPPADAPFRTPSVFPPMRC